MCILDLAPIPPLTPHVGILGFAFEFYRSHVEFPIFLAPWQGSPLGAGRQSEAGSSLEENRSGIPERNWLLLQWFELPRMEI